MPCINCKQLKKKENEKYIVLTYILLTCCTRRRGGGTKGWRWHQGRRMVCTSFGLKQGKRMQKFSTT